MQMSKQKIFKISSGSIYATGKRKTSVARVWINKGSGKMTINGLSADKYFNLHNNSPRSLKSVSDIALASMFITDNKDKFDVICFVKGGGFTGQLDSIRHAVAKCIRSVDENNVPKLRSAGLLTRDSRVVERKKYGKRKARKSTQFSKR